MSIAEIDHIWNADWSNRKNLTFIVCGSAASWMIKKLLDDKGGLHNRITHRMLIAPWLPKDIQSFFKTRGVSWRARTVMDYNLILGGIPYYLEYLNPKKSIAENIDELFFSNKDNLSSEFDRLFSSLFSDSKDHVKIVKVLGAHAYGLTRDDLLKKTRLSSGGWIHDKLVELEAAGFIIGFIPYGHKKKQKTFRLTDEFCGFYLRWIGDEGSRKIQVKRGQSIFQSAERYQWMGIQFENFILKNSQAVIDAIKINNIVSWAGPYRDDQGQIDLLIDRSDGCMSLIEIKYTEQPLVWTSEMEKSLQKKVFEFENKFKKQIIPCLLSFAGIKGKTSAHLIASDKVLGI